MYLKCQNETAVHVRESIVPCTRPPFREKPYDNMSNYCECECREAEKEQSEERGHKLIAGRDAQPVHTGWDTRRERVLAIGDSRKFNKQPSLKREVVECLMRGLFEHGM